jgi:hypothetical protein
MLECFNSFSGVCLGGRDRLSRLQFSPTFGFEAILKDDVFL